jgi:hypothetical protein
VEDAPLPPRSWTNPIRRDSANGDRSNVSLVVSSWVIPLALPSSVEMIMDAAALAVMI